MGVRGQLPPTGTHQAGTGFSLQPGCPRICLSAAVKQRGWLLWVSGTEDLDLNELLTLLPHPACCAHQGLELCNLFQYRGEKLSARQGDQDPLGVLVFVLHDARGT